MEKAAIRFWPIFLFWFVFGMGYYCVLPNTVPVLPINVLFCLAMGYTTQVVFSLFTKNQRHFALALLSSFFLLDVWSITRFTESETLMAVLWGTPEKEPLIAVLGVLGLILAISVSWHTSERPYPRWRAIINVLISITGVIGILHMKKAGFAAWHPMASIAVYAAWLLCVTEMLCQRLVAALKAMFQRIKAWSAAFCHAVASVRQRYQRLCAWAQRMRTSAKQGSKMLVAGLLGSLGKCRQQFFQFLGWCWQGICGRCENAKQLLLKLLAHLVKGALYISCYTIAATSYIGYAVAVYTMAAVLWLVDRCRQYYPPLKGYAACLLRAIATKLKLKAMLQ